MGLDRTGPGDTKRSRSHTITVLFVCVMILVVISGAFSPKVDFSSLSQTQQIDMRSANLKRSLIAVCAAYLVYSALQGPETHMVRPHPAVWKVMHGLFVLYLLFLIFVLCQETHDARMVFKFISPELGVELPEQAYGGDCRIYMPEDENSKFRIVQETVYDRFVVAHILGWWGKAVVLRDRRLLWALSIAFELMELTFQHWLKNFNECWWDSWILDVLVCNFLGIYLGMKTVRFFEGQTYNWTGIKRAKGLSGSFRRSVMLFTPASVDLYYWNSTASPRKFFQSAFLVALCLVFELNAFFLKYVLWIPPPSFLNPLRLVLWFGISNIAVREYYVFITSKRGMRLTKMGPNAWLALAVALVEIMVIVKHGRGMFEAPWPRHVVWFWGIVAVSGFTWLISWHVRLRRAGEGDRATTKGVKCE